MEPTPEEPVIEEIVIEQATNSENAVSSAAPVGQIATTAVATSTCMTQEAC